MESIRKELLNVWRKEDLKDLERRLVRSRDELNLHIVIDLRCVPLLPIVRAC